VIIYCDGNSKRYGYMPKDGKPKIIEQEQPVKHAEYKAIIKALESVSHDEKVTLFSDSIVAVNQLKGVWKIKEPKLKELCAMVYAIAELKRLDVQIFCISRRYNMLSKIINKGAIEDGRITTGTVQLSKEPRIRCDHYQTLYIQTKSNH
jgi:hypothetical protein